jgi:hypothetical protein
LAYRLRLLTFLAVSEIEARRLIKAVYPFLYISLLEAHPEGVMEFTLFLHVIRNSSRGRRQPEAVYLILAFVQLA